VFINLYPLLTSQNVKSNYALAQTYKCISPNTEAAYINIKHVQKEEEYVYKTW